MSGNDSDNLRFTPEGRRTVFRPFTILVVAFIVAVVAAVLFPMFERTGGHARKDDCSYNLKECAAAMQMYCQDYDGLLPSSAIVRHSSKWNKSDFAHFATRLGHVPVPTNTTPNTWTQLLYPHMIFKDQMFCPSDESDHSGPNSRVSYYWKTAVDKAWYGVGCKKPYRKLTDFPNCADLIVLYERAGFHDLRGHLWWKHPPGLKNGVRINVAYLDTHVRSVQLTNATTDDPERPELATNGEPMFFNLDQSKLKGPGNPPPAEVPANHTDPSRHSDMLP